MNILSLEREICSVCKYVEATRKKRGGLLFFLFYIRTYNGRNLARGENVYLKMKAKKAPTGLKDCGGEKKLKKHCLSCISDGK